MQTVVNDDFGDVYGVFFAITGEGYTYRQLTDYADELKKDLLRCEDVRRLRSGANSRRRFMLNSTGPKCRRSGLSPSLIFGTLNLQNVVEQSGNVKIGDDYIRIAPRVNFPVRK